MSTVAGATPNNAASLPIDSPKSNNMSLSSVVTETAPLNGRQVPAAVATAETTAENSALENPARNNMLNTNEAKGEEQRSSISGSDAPPLRADLKRILAEVARTGTCSWLSWHPSSSDPKDNREGQAAASYSAAATAEAAQASSSSTASNIPAASAAASSHNNPNNSTQKQYALGSAIPSSRSQSRRPYTNHFNAAGPGVSKATRRKHRNGVKMSRRRVQEAANAAAAGGGSKTQTTTTTTSNSASSSSGGGGRKRPLSLIRTSATANGNAAAPGGPQTVFSPGSVGSGRTSGSEPDDSTQYECDSEGTSATSCSEVSLERRDHHLRNMQRGVAIPANAKKPPSNFSDGAEDEEVASSLDSDYHCLKDVFRMSLGLVLDHWYRQRGGYKLSPAEKRRSNTAKAENTSMLLAPAAVSAASNNLVNGENSHNISSNGSNNNRLNIHNFNNHVKSINPATDNSILPDTKKPALSLAAEDLFQQRRRRLLVMLGRTGDKSASMANNNLSLAAQRFQAEDEGPPFTIQRIAEVLLAPERYYTQTHKLCNCLEKLLLITSSTSAFGGSTGGMTSQSRLEEQELAALAEEKGRLESEFRQQVLKRRHSSVSDDAHMDGGGDASSRAHGSPSRDEGHGTSVNDNDPSPEKKPENESSSREMLEAAARSLRTKFDHVGIDPHSAAAANRDVRAIADSRGMTNSPPPPSLAMSAAVASNMALPGHTAVGNFVRQHLPEQNAEHPSIARVPSPILFSQGNEAAPLHAAPNMHNMLHMHHAAPLAGVSMGSTPFEVVTIQAGVGGAPTSGNLPGSNEGADLEGRSSASNSDVDSESDDVSFDDSASDRSDGSDSGHYEPFTAARAMALNRIQQQQRLQSRVLTSLALHQSEGGFRPPADSEYQSGDSIDSTRGEDSGGSDSSSSDVAD